MPRLSWASLAQNIATLASHVWRTRPSPYDGVTHPVATGALHGARGGIFLQLQCQPDVDTEALLPLAQQTGVSSGLGRPSLPPVPFPQALRISFALYETDALVQGIARLAKALEVYHAGR